MRLDLFLPFRKKRGPVGRLIGRVAPSWLSTPWRRVTQGLCLAALAAGVFGVGAPVVKAFLAADPLVGIGAAVAARALVPALLWAGAVLAVGLLLPRWFCAYACPLGTLIDLSDWALGRWLKPMHLKRRGWWTHLRYAVLAAVLAAAAGGVALGGHVAAIPLLTRGLAAVASPDGPAQWAAAAVLVAVLAGCVLGRRLWCRCLCPTGAVLSIAVRLRLTDRKVGPACIECGRCVEACSFDAVAADYTTRPDACTFCQDCGGVCPTRAIRFVARWDAGAPRAARGRPLSRRGFIAALACGGAAGAAGAMGIRRRPGTADATFVRPPGAVAEADFLGLCVRCGECVRACPTGILVPAGLAGGVAGLWTPRADADVAFCDPACNACGQVCPTGAIRPLTIARKRVTPMGLAVVDRQACLSWTQRLDCGRCIPACPYGAIERRVIPTLDDSGMPVPDEDTVAPWVDPDKCVGCGACQHTCHHANVAGGGPLTEAAIRVVPRRAGATRDLPRRARMM